MSQIEFKDVSKVYPNGHVGLKDINLNIEKVIRNASKYRNDFSTF